MAEPAPDSQSNFQEPTQLGSVVDRIEVATTPDHTNGRAKKVKKAKEVHWGPTVHHEDQEKPSRLEIFSWYLYELCSYFIQTTLIPIVFPLIISQIVSFPPEPANGWTTSHNGLVCSDKEMILYERLTSRQIRVHNLKFSPLGWTSISWALGLILAAPILGFVSTPLDYGRIQQLISGAATLIGALSCLPAGFFRTVKIFPPYISIIIAAHVVAIASHTRNLGLMVRAYSGSAIPKHQFPVRSAVGGWFSLYATALGCLGSAIIAAFTYHMLKESEQFISLWVVSIFSGLKWLVGVVHVAIAFRPGAVSQSVPKTHFVSVLKYPHALGSLVCVFLSSFTTMCIFTGGLLFLVGHLCLKPIFFLYLWLTYFVFPSFSLPLLQPLQHLIKADAVKMQLLGLFLSVLTSGMGFYFRGTNWHKHSILIFAAIQSTSAGLLYAFGRVLLLNCAPAGKEGAFSVWFSWVKAFGTCVGFAVASALHGSIASSFGLAFGAGVLCVIVLIFGNISDIGGAVAAGHVREDADDNEP